MLMKTMYLLWNLPFFKMLQPKTNLFLFSQNGLIITQQTSMFYSYVVLLIYVNETTYLLGNLPFFKIHVNHFMARDDLPCANVISKCTLKVRGLVPL